jgi:hypothetical protein
VFGHLIVIFSTAYCGASNTKPFSDMKRQLKYANKLGMNVLEQYRSNIQWEEFVNFIANIIE